MAHGTAGVISYVLTETVVKQPVPVSSFRYERLLYLFQLVYRAASIC